MGADRTAIAWRKGRCITKTEARRGIDTMEIAGLVGKIIRDDKPAKVNIDVGGLGVGVFDRLMELGYSRSVVQAVNFGSKPIEPPVLGEMGVPAGGPANRRSELWCNMKKVLEEGRFSLPDDDALQADLVSTGYKYNSAGQLLLESKQDMRKRGVPSPDLADAVALCFSEGDDATGLVRNANFHREIIYPGYGEVLMSKPYEIVWVQMRRPRDGDPGIVEEGRYRIEGDVVDLARQGRQATPDQKRKTTDRTQTKSRRQSQRRSQRD